MRFLLSCANVPLTIHSKPTEYDPKEVVNTDIHIYIDMYKMTLTWLNEPREWIFHPLSTWPVAYRTFRTHGRFVPRRFVPEVEMIRPFRWQVGHISVAYFSFSRHQYLFLFLFYRIVVIWLSYSVSVWSLGQHVCRFSPAIAHLSSFWCFADLQNHPVSLKIYAYLLIANSKSLLNIKSWRHPT